MAQGGPLRESWVAGLHGQFSGVGVLRGWDEQRLGINDRDLPGDTLARADEQVKGAPTGHKDDAGPLVHSDLRSDRTARPTRSESSDDARSGYKDPPPATRYGRCASSHFLPRRHGNLPHFGTALKQGW
jgi:hypothetical protein